MKKEPDWQIDIKTLGCNFKSFSEEQLLKLQNILYFKEPNNLKRSFEVVAANIYSLLPENLRLSFSSLVKKTKKNIPLVDICSPGSLNLKIAANKENTTSVVLVTHDVDYRIGYENLIKIASFEYDNKIKSSYYFLTNAAYKIDRKVLSDLLAMNHEVGLHGYKYDLRLAYQEMPAIYKKLSKAKKYIEDIAGIKVEGFRNHSLLISNNLLSALDKLGFLYDSGIYIKDLSEPFAVNFNWPFKYKNSSLFEIPVAYPQDTVIFRELAFNVEEGVDFYQRRIEAIFSLKGVPCFNFHPSTIINNWSFYTKFIKTLNSKKLKSLTPAEYIKKNFTL